MKKSVALLSNCWALALSCVVGSDIGNVLLRTVIDLVVVVTVQTMERGTHSSTQRVAAV